MLQTGAKIQLGGLKEGLVREAYQVGMAGVVAREPMKPAAKGRASAKIRMRNLDLGFMCNYKQFLIEY